MEHRLRLGEEDTAILRGLLEREMLDKYGPLKKSGRLRAHVTLYARLSRPRRGRHLLMFFPEIETKKDLKAWIERRNRSPTPQGKRAAEEAPRR